jgi:hypothetical protein
VCLYKRHRTATHPPTRPSQLKPCHRRGLSFDRSELISICHVVLVAGLAPPVLAFSWEALPGWVSTAGLSRARVVLLDAMPPSSLIDGRGTSDVARIWFLKLGYARTLGAPAYSRPFRDCLARLELRPGQWWAPPGDLPVIGNPSLAAEATAPEAVLCEVDGDEVTGHEWRSGYYLLDLSPAQVTGILGSPAPAFPARLSDAHSP